MKNTDKKIINFIGTVAIIAIMSSLFAFTEQTVKFIGFIGIAAYFMFIMAHLGMAFPAFFIAFTVYDFTSINFKNIKQDSEIIFYAIHIPILTAAFFFVYCIIPIILSMMGNYTIDIDLALKSLNEALK